MVFNSLTRKDNLILVGGVATLLAASTLSLILDLPMQVESAGDVALLISVIAAMYFVYKGIKLVGGTAGRALALVAISVGYYGLYIIPHLYYHITRPETIGPIKGPAFELFLHASTALIFFIAAWGFYIFWKGGKE